MVDSSHLQKGSEQLLPVDPRTCSSLLQKPRVRNVSARNSGAGNGCTNFMGAADFLIFLLDNPQPIKNPRFRAGGSVFFGKAGAEVPILFSDLFFSSAKPPPRIRVKQARFRKLAFLQQKGAFLGPKRRDFRPFRATVSVKKFGPFLCDKWSTGTFGSVRYLLRFAAQKLGFGA